MSTPAVLLVSAAIFTSLVGIPQASAQDTMPSELSHVWESVITVDSSTGEVLDETAYGAWDAVVVQEVQTGKVLAEYSSAERGSQNMLLPPASSSSIAELQGWK